MPMDIKIGDVVELKKQHACGCKEFEITRVGMDIKIKCTKCLRSIMLDRETVEKKIKKIIIGLLAGFISGLFSTGGGLILVPAFTYLLELDTVEARATSIMCILPMVLTTSFFYAKNKYIDWRLGFLCAIGGIIGSYIGSKVISKIPTYILKISFAIFLIYVALYMIGIV